MATPLTFNFNTVHSSWHSCIQTALEKMDKEYINHLCTNCDWLPGNENIFNAFSLPLDKVKFVLLGESPYPRTQSANGYAFWDQAVENIWSPGGLSKSVNRATSLRNLIKMLLVAEDLLKPTQTDQETIAKVDKRHLVQTNQELFTNLLNHGFLLLNASLVLQNTRVTKDAKAWQPFLEYILNFLFQHNPNIQLILLGNIANTMDKLIRDPLIRRFYAEHPYNISFITNPNVIEFFRPFHLLRK